MINLGFFGVSPRFLDHPCAWGGTSNTSSVGVGSASSPSSVGEAILRGRAFFTPLVDNQWIAETNDMSLG